MKPIPRTQLIPSRSNGKPACLEQRGCRALAAAFKHLSHLEDIEFPAGLYGVAWRLWPARLPRVESEAAPW